MTERIRIRQDAEHDIERLYSWYESQAPGLGRRLIDALENTYVILNETPLIYEDIHFGIRRVVLSKCPVGVFYKVVGEFVHIVAVDHLARDPIVWQSRK